MKLSGLVVRRRIVADRVPPANAVKDLGQCFSRRAASAMRDLSTGIFRDLGDADPLDLGARNGDQRPRESEALPHLNAVYVRLKFERGRDDLLFTSTVEKS